MIYLRTGLPGASKTLNSLRELVLSQDPSRPMFYNNVKLLLLDMDVCRSFAGWFYGWYFPRLKDQSQKRRLTKIMKPIHDNDDFLDLRDVPWLQAAFDAHDHFETWVYWVRRVYPRKKLEVMENLLSASNGSEVDKFEMVKQCNLHFTYFENPRSWMDLPKRSIVFIDECQQFFPPRATGSKVPPAVAALETHRHGGYDIHFVTQDRTLTDANLRKLVGRHVHFYNPFGGSRVTRKEQPRCFDPNDFHDSKQATKKIVKRDSKFYGLYWSAEIHTHKFKFPRVLFFGLLALCVVGWSAYSVADRFAPKENTTVVAQPAAHTSGAEKSSSVDSAQSSLDVFMLSLVKDVYISGSIMRVGNKRRSFEYVFYRSSDDAIFEPEAVGLIVEPLDRCLANLRIGNVVRPITCNPFYVRVPVKDEESSRDSDIDELASDADQHRPNIKVF
ncbi:zonular occludens toxin domain-containing protein [Vibrio fluvialis]|uniref:zonular occludens toxin domain-containing protein n=1 Tax=Vibrio fluvialis TaxID=676 RepID=UPI00192CCC23|nr:zonular occludens toxin domain-containing protein [Vibrio fluvialis]MBL4307022.1 zonular occludens toxin [Vibrio fluvialis]MBY8095243.1 zonular occludens toxin domain-containing protein [Vibrio fluvialis]